MSWRVSLVKFGIGEGRVIARAVARHAEAQRAVEIVVAPGAEAGLAVRRQVGRIDAAEGGIDPLAPGERFCGIGGMAARAIAGVGQRLAARDVSASVGVGSALSWARRIADGERSAQKHAERESSACPTSSLHHLASWGVIARKRRGGDVMPFRAEAPGRHKPKSCAAIPGTKLRSLKARLHCRDLWCAAAKIRHRLVLTSSDD